MEEPISEFNAGMAVTTFNKKFRLKATESSVKEYQKMAEYYVARFRSMYRGRKGIVGSRKQNRIKRSK